MAYDFSVLNKEGKRIYYNIDSKKPSTASVTCQYHGMYNYSLIIGELTIPSKVDYNGKQYNVESIEEWAFYKSNNITSIVIQKGIIKIGYNAFAGCTSLIRVVLPNGIANIENGAFSGCHSLTTINIPNSIISIGNEAFSSCISLKKIELSSNIDKIEDLTFCGCDNLDTIVLLASNPPTISNRISLLERKDLEIVIPCGSRDNYDANKQWKEINKTEDCIENKRSK
jgi:hypothetical protein